jgi:hypothetical protein
MNKVSDIVWILVAALSLGIIIAALGWHIGAAIFMLLWANNATRRKNG